MYKIAPTDTAEYLDSTYEKQWCSPQIATNTGNLSNLVSDAIIIHHPIIRWFFVFVQHTLPKQPQQFKTNDSSNQLSYLIEFIFQKNYLILKYSL